MTVTQNPAGTNGRGTATPFYVTGGTMPQGAASYVKRQADSDLRESLLRGEYCFVLNTRQMGKSSLKVRTASFLRQQGVVCADLDLTAVGQNVTPDQWYDGLLSLLAVPLGIEDELEDFWLDNERLGPMQRFVAAIRQIALPAMAKGRNVENIPSLVIFVDEIDAVRSLPFPADEFFAGIRECYNRRTEDSVMNRLTFCLIGVATPADLISDTRMSPFNIGRRIKLTDFTPAEAAPLASELPGGKATLDRILYWTNGHPYLTQRLCRAAVEERRGGAAVTPATVDSLCENLFLSKAAQESDDNLAFVRNRLLRSEADLASLLDLYQKIRAGKRVPDDETNPLCGILRLSGSVAERGGLLKVRNRIYDRVFDKEWVTAHMPDAERRRQRAAYQRGMAWSAGVGTLITSSMTGLAVYGFLQANAARLARDEAGINLQQANAERSRVGRLAGKLQNALTAQGTTNRKLSAALNNVTAQKGRADDAAAASRAAEKRATDLAGNLTVALGDARASRERAKGEAERANGEANRANRNASRADAEASRSAQLLYLSRMGGLSRAWEDGDAETVRRTLAETASSPFRGFEWAYWQRQLNSAALTADTEDSPYCLSVSPDGRRVAVANWEDGGIILDASTGRRLLRLRAGAGLNGLRAVAFSPDGARLLTGGQDGVARVFDAERGKIRFELRGHTDAIQAVAWSPDGTRLATSAVGGEARLWDARDGKLIATLTLDKPDEKAPTSRFIIVRRLIFSPDSGTLAAGDEGGMIHLIDTQTGAERTAWKAHDRSARGVAYSPDGKTLATGGGDGKIRLWDARTQAALSELDGGGAKPTASGVMCLTFSPDGREIAVTGANGGLFLLDSQTGELNKTLKVGRGAGHSVIYLAGGRRVAASDWSGSALRVWDARPETDALPHSVFDRAAAFFPDGRRVALGGVDGGVTLWDAVQRKTIRRFKAHSAAINALSVSPDGGMLATSSDDRSVSIWDGATGRKIRTFASVTGRAIFGAAFSPDGKRLAFNDDRPFVADLTTGSRTPLPNLAGSALAWSGDGQFLLSGGFRQQRTRVSDGRSVQIYPAPREEERGPDSALTPFGTNSLPYMAACRISPDGGRVLLVYAGDRGVSLRDAATGRPLLRLNTSGVVRDALFLPDGQRIATAHEDGTIRLWDAETGRELLRLRAGGSVAGLIVAPDGRRLLSVADRPKGSEVRLWEIASEGEISAVLAAESRGKEARSAAARRRAALLTEDPALLAEIKAGRVPGWPANISPPNLLPPVKEANLWVQPPARARFEERTNSFVRIAVERAGVLNWYVHFQFRSDIAFPEGKYVLQFRARADRPALMDPVVEAVSVNEPLHGVVELSARWRAFRYTINLPQGKYRTAFFLSYNPANIEIADVLLTPAAPDDPAQARAVQEKFLNIKTAQSSPVVIAEQASGPLPAAVQSAAQSPENVLRDAAHGNENGDLGPGGGSLFVEASRGAGRARREPDGATAITVERKPRDDWAVHLAFGNFPVTAGRRYRLEFWARADGERTIRVRAERNEPDYQSVGLDRDVTLNRRWRRFGLTFAALETQPVTALKFMVGNAIGDVRIVGATLTPLTDKP